MGYHSIRVQCSDMLNTKSPADRQLETLSHKFLSVLCNPILFLKIFLYSPAFLMHTVRDILRILPALALNANQNLLLVYIYVCVCVCVEAVLSL